MKRHNTPALVYRRKGADASGITAAPSAAATPFARAARGQAGRDVSHSRKRYCPQCRTRVSRSAKKCGYCGKHLLSWANLTAITLTLLAALFLLGRFLGFA